MTGELNQQPAEDSTPYEQIGSEYEPIPLEHTQVDRVEPEHAVIQPLITTEEQALTKMIRQGLGGGDGGIITRRHGPKTDGYKRGRKGR